MPRRPSYGKYLVHYAYVTRPIGGVRIARARARKESGWNGIRFVRDSAEVGYDMT